MQDIHWTPKEKQIARTVFQRAAMAEEQELLERFKKKAAAMKEMNDMVALQHAIGKADRKYQEKYDFRYSQLISVFGCLVREGRISMEELEGLSEEKLDYIGRYASL